MADDDRDRLTRAEERLKAQEDRIRKLEENQRWVVMLVIAAVIAGILKGVIIQ